MTTRYVEPPTGERSNTVEDYESAATASQTHALALDAGWLRWKFDLYSGDARELHHEAQLLHLANQAALKAQKGVATLLNELSAERGMSWADIAAAINVSPSAIRKWRSGGEATAEHRLGLAKLAAFLDLLEDYLIEDPAQWMEVPLALPPGYVIRPIDLYTEGHPSILLDLVGHRILTAERMMDEIDEDWREIRRSDFEVITAADGHRAIRTRK